MTLAEEQKMFWSLVNKCEDACGHALPLPVLRMFVDLGRYIERDPCVAQKPPWQVELNDFEIKPLSEFQRRAQTWHVCQVFNALVSSRPNAGKLELVNLTAIALQTSQATVYKIIHGYTRPPKRKEPTTHEQTIIH